MIKNHQVLESLKNGRKKLPDWNGTPKEAILRKIKEKTTKPRQKYMKLVHIEMKIHIY